MGLDMYLNVRNKNNPEDEFEAMYWRKANQVLNFLDKEIGGIEDCKDYKIEPKTIAKLIKTCKNVLEKATDGERVTDISYAHKHLPTMSGFFFGPTDYDQYYVYDIQNTVEQLSKVMKSFNPETQEFWFYAWW